MTTRPDPAKAGKRRFRPQSRLQRKLAGALALAMALVAAGALYAVFAPEAQEARADADPTLLREGEQVYNNTCITCHGANLEGVEDRGPSLIGVGEAAVYFQTSTGRMPLARQGAEAYAKEPRLEPSEIDAVSAYIHAHGGGPERPEESGVDLQGDNPARGGELFRTNCTSCHHFTGRGGALSAGKDAPALDGVDEDIIYTAMTSGPGNMPKFSHRQLTEDEKKDIIAYVQSVTDGNNNPGGHPLGGYGPMPEGLIAWIVGLAGLVGVTMWIGAKR
ncbi:menaquinol-cytochrome c reductase cytochrome c1 subunit precursor [Haloechinothrix alba]|uniref:Cytochrome bc1 complex cytochrome c subunit n=1 Tax=Haloechinothrix alba TaxID=664784 RepID=A0A238WI96_9PSEU|nr:c-type cytochrome [Haloechinothrix alba]SNR46197.1 menaquinol-cytochrome c reductase cytochrome c1 subunit precursor [Haloechinothrix alba]